MKASTMVNDLNNLIEKYGDLDLVYSVDDEGNAFCRVNINPSPGDFTSGEFLSAGGEDWDENLNEVNVFCIN